ncbi:MAG: TolB family protein [Spirulina sp. SIO3F2]|nr:TolB family protein [Spirulina sp. SIO3F2]
MGAIAGGCGGYPQVLNLTYDAGGRALNSPASELSPQFTGEYLVFVSDRNGSHDVYLYNLEARQLIDLPGLNNLTSSAADPSISEDGQYIVYTASRLGIADIYIYDRETGLNRNLTEGLQAEVRRPVISADGSRIAFEANREGQWDVLVYARSGEEVDGSE